MLAKLLPLIHPHQIYVEPFGGGGSVLLAKPPSSVEVYNDLDSGLVNFFRVLRNSRKFKRLQFLCSLTPYSREEYETAREKWKACRNDAERAHLWFVVARMSFSGKFGASWSYSVTTSSRGMAGAVSSYLSAIDNLPSIHSRLMRVQIEHSSAFDVIRTYDGPESFFYLDPPYVPGTRRSGQYAYELTEEDHERLVDLLLKVRGKVMLSGYENPIYRKLERYGWRRVSWDRVCHTPGGTRPGGLLGAGSVLQTQKRVECVWMNYRANARRASLITHSVRESKKRR